MVCSEVVKRFKGWRVLAGAVLAAGALAACQSPARMGAADEAEPDEAPAHAAPTPQETEHLHTVFPGWELRPMPGKRWQPFVPVQVDGVRGLQVQASSSLSLMRQKMVPPRTGPATVQFSWWVDQLVEGADLSDSGASDAPAQLAVGFDGDRAKLPTKHLMLSELSQLLTGDPLPYASLVYAWTNEHPVGTVIPDPRTDRIRYLVVEQGPANLRKWVHHRRDVQADYRRVFGEEPGPIITLAVMADTDNTRTRTRSVFGPVSLSGHLGGNEVAKKE